MQTTLTASLLTLLCASSPAAPAHPAQRPPTVSVEGPTIIAFRRPFTEAELTTNGDLADAVSDFDYYLPGIQAWCGRAGVRFERLDVSVFRVQRGGKTHTVRLRSGGLEFGFYFATPARPGRVQPGVLLDTDMPVFACPFFTPAALASGACTSPPSE